MFRGTESPIKPPWKTVPSSRCYRRHALMNETPDIEAEEMHTLTSFQRDLLFAVAGCDGPSGLDVKSELEGKTDETILPGQLYPNLDELHEDGLLRKEDQDGRTNQYELTDDGRSVLEEICEWQAAYVDDRPPDA